VVRAIRAAAAALGGLLLAGCGSAMPDPQSPGSGVADYVVVTPRSFLAALDPLLAHRRAQGHRVAVVVTDDEEAQDAAALRRAVRAEGGSALRFVMLVGDVAIAGEPAADRIPAFRLPKMPYFVPSDDFFTPGFTPFHAEEETYPSDRPYGDSQAAVGRLPARSPAEVRGFVDKLIAYETQPIDGVWPRHLVVQAGPANFGTFIDWVIESTAMQLLATEVPAEYDIDFVFAKPGSEWGERPDRLGASLTERANQGALIVAYVGHSSPLSFDTVEYRDRWYGIGGRDDLARMRVARGAPIFVSLSCSAGAFDLPDGERSMAEEAVLNPEGPIASFAASRESHPYANMLYGQALIELLRNHPATLGEGIEAVKRDMAERSNPLGEHFSGIDTDALKEEHAGLYNLLGDPATRLRWPEAVELTLASDVVAPGAPITASLASNDLAGATAVVTLEVGRTEPRVPLVPNAEIESLPDQEAFAAIAENRQRIADKVLERREQVLEGGRAQVALTAPPRPGRYEVKAFVLGGKKSGWAHAVVEVR
jgi:peptidase C25-like protein